MQHKPLSERRRKEIVTLKRKKGRDALGLMLIEGWRSVQSALEAGAPVEEVFITESFYTDPDAYPVLQQLLAREPVPTYLLSQRAADKISAVNQTQGILATAQIAEAPLASFEQMHKVIALDGVQDPGNVGTIIRTAAWFGFEGIIAGSNTADFYNPKVVRSTMGGIWDVKLAQTDHLPSVIDALKAAGIHTACADLEGMPLTQWSAPERVALVIGSEAHGVSGEIVKGVDTQLTIEKKAAAKSGVESLNAAMAAGILMHKVFDA